MNFAVAVVGTVASVAIAVLAIVVTLRLSRIAERRDDRERRQAFAADLLLWMDAGVKHTITKREHLSADKAYVTESQRLSATAAVLGDEGANEFLVAIRDLTEILGQYTLEERVRVVRPVLGILRLSVARWVREGGEADRPIPLEEWVQGFIEVTADRVDSTETAEPTAPSGHDETAPSNEPSEHPTPRGQQNDHV